MRFLSYKPAVILLLGALLAPGCGKGDSTPSASPQGSRAGAPTPQAAQGSLKQGIVRQGVPNELRQLALSYVAYITTYNRAPKRLDDLKPDMERESSKLLQAIQDGYYTVVWQVHSPSSSTILAYEKDADSKGLRFVVMGDASVSKMSEQELQTALARR